VEHESELVHDVVVAMSPVSMQYPWTGLWQICPEAQSRPVTHVFGPLDASGAGLGAGLLQAAMHPAISDAPNSMRSRIDIPAPPADLPRLIGVHPLASRFSLIVARRRRSTVRGPWSFVEANRFPHAPALRPEVLATPLK
jgi:hypothetical protein